jgi:hypothetical protein
VIDCDFDPNDPENESSEFYYRSLRICLHNIISFALFVKISRTENNNKETGE